MPGSLKPLLILGRSSNLNISSLRLCPPIPTDCLTLETLLLSGPPVRGQVLPLGRGPHLRFPHNLALRTLAGRLASPGFLLPSASGRLSVAPLHTTQLLPGTHSSSPQAAPWAPPRAAGSPANHGLARLSALRRADSWEVSSSSCSGQGSDPSSRTTAYPRGLPGLRDVIRMREAGGIRVRESYASGQLWALETANPRLLLG